MAEPIWRDYYVDFGQQEYVDYEIRLIDGKIIFSGRAYPRPEDNSIYVKINDICADYLENIGMQMEDGFASNDIAKVFRVFNSQGTLIDTVTFVNDWSYDPDRANQDVLSDPINGVFDVRMPLLYSVSKAKSIIIDAQDTSASFNIDFSEDFHVGYDRVWTVEASSSGTLTLANIFANTGEITIDDKVYRGKASCHTHALYYINAYGGWDFLLLEGRTIETDNYVRHEHKLNYDNRSEEARGTRNYLNEIEKSYMLHTGWLVKDEAARMHHLLGSTQVYLYEIQTNRMIPVTITDNSCKYKTFQSEGGKLVEYEINVKVARERIRR